MKRIRGKSKEKGPILLGVAVSSHQKIRTPVRYKNNSHLYTQAMVRGPKSAS